MFFTLLLLPDFHTVTRNALHHLYATFHATVSLCCIRETLNGLLAALTTKWIQEAHPKTMAEV